jgi:DNA (cytosine-5)-methyltransferase 1
MRTREQTVVHFAGGGGSCTGIEEALGFSPDHAINHDAAALGMHRTNHPLTQHHIEDVFEVDPEAIKKEGGPIGLAWFSPDCKHFSKAKGGKPLDKRIRGLVLVMLRWAKAGTRVMFMENVEEIQTWGPLVEMWKDGTHGWYPDPAAKGRTWRAFLDCMTCGIDPQHPDLEFILDVLAGSVTREDCVRGFGYAFDARELRACDYGAPTIRKRLFAIFRNDGRPIEWPEATHADPAKGSDLKPWHTVAECIDWDRPTPSIFLRGKAAKKARCKRPLAKATLRRIASGIDRYVMRSASPFIVSVNRSDGGLCEHRGAVLTEHAQASNQRNMPVDQPMRTACAGVKGGHFALLTGTLVQTGYGEREGQQPRALDAQAPLGTVVSGGGKHALAAASLVKLRGTNVGDKADAPMHTASAGGNHHGVVAAYLAQHNGGFNAVDGRPADEPMSTISSRGSQQQLVTASMAAYYGSEADGQAVTEPARTSTTKPRLGLVETTSVQPMTPAQEASARRVAKFLRAHGVQFEGEFATVGGFVIVDIGMRMLTPRELYRAQGFPEAYVIDHATFYDPRTGETTTRPLTKEEQIRMCGNSVCPPVAAALVRKNCPEMAIRTASRWQQPQAERRAA